LVFSKNREPIDNPNETVNIDASLFKGDITERYYMNDGVKEMLLENSNSVFDQVGQIIITEGVAFEGP